MTNILIYAENYKDACRFLDKLFYNFKSDEIEKIIKTGRYEIIMKDGTKYIVKTNVDSCRGIKFKKLYVDKRTSQKDINILSYSFCPIRKIEYF
jgi:uncharacterized protein YlzI (FlbEa/FlbD family)